MTCVGGFLFSNACYLVQLSLEWLTGNNLVYFFFFLFFLFHTHACGFHLDADHSLGVRSDGNFEWIRYNKPIVSSPKNTVKRGL